jgi:hypothetical protein
VAWEERCSEHFAARGEEADAAAAEDVLATLEAFRAELAGRLPTLPDEVVDVVLHGTRAQLHVAQPALLAVPASLRAVVLGRASGHSVHLLSPRVHRDARAAPALYARLAVVASSPALRRPARRLRHAWLVDGAGDWLAGRVPSLEPHVRRRLRDGPPPPFPPPLRDAPLFGGPAVALVARERGPEGVLALLAQPGPVPGLAAVWPRHLERLATRRA